jgi:hypothetical protein
MVSVLHACYPICNAASQGPVNITRILIAVLCVPALGLHAGAQSTQKLWGAAQVFKLRLVIGLSARLVWE